MRPVPETVPTECRAAVLRDFGTMPQIETVPIPRQIEPGALLVKTECCTLCGSDVHLVRGNLNRKVALPVIAGHEMTGRVVARGEGTDTDSVGQPLNLGDRIVWTRTNCGQCYMCTVVAQPTLCPDARAYMYETMERSPHLLGGMSEYVYVLPQSGRIVVPEAIDAPLASMASCAFRSVVHAFAQLGALRPTDTIVVQGTGPLGLLAIGLARHAGAHRILAIGAPKARLFLATEFGAYQTLSIDTQTADERRDRILEETAGRGADVVMEFAGHPAAFREGMTLVRRGGAYLLVGQLGAGEVPFRPSDIVHRNLRLIGSLAGGARDYWTALQLIEAHQGDLPFHKLISNSYLLENVSDAIGAMERQSEIKPLISFDL